MKPANSSVYYNIVILLSIVCFTNLYLYTVQKYILKETMGYAIQ